MNSFKRVLKRTIRIGYHYWSRTLQRLTDTDQTFEPSWNTIHSRLSQDTLLPLQRAGQAAELSNSEAFARLYTRLYPDDPSLRKVDHERAQTVAMFILDHYQAEMLSTRKASSFPGGLVGSNSCHNLDIDEIAYHSGTYKMGQEGNHFPK